jgi:hypothetical protein
VNQAFLDKKRGEQNIKIQEPPPFISTVQDLVLLKNLFVELGQLGERDKLMFADKARTLVTRQPQEKNVNSLGFDVADALDVVCIKLNMKLTQKEHRSYTIRLGKLIAEEYREKHNGSEPGKNSRFVDGKNRLINWYKEDDADWIYEIIEDFLTDADL